MALAGGRQVTADQIKEAVRARDDYRCTECGMTVTDHLAITGRTLEVHRLVPGSPYTLEGCITLCRRCHGPKPRRPHGARLLEGWVNIDGELLRKARIIATIYGLKFATYLDGLLREAIEAEYARCVRPPE